MDKKPHDNTTTGGDSGPQLVGLSKMFYNPQGYNVLPFKHTFTRDGKNTLTGYFLPAHVFSINPEYVDARGVTDHKRFKEYYEKRWAMMEDSQDVLVDKAEHCFTPEDALIQAGDNIFDSAALSERLTEIRTNRRWIKPKKVRLLWDKNVGDGFQKVAIHESPSGDLLMVEPPMTDPDGNVYKNLYVAGIDAIDMGKKDSATDSDVSDFCIVIKRRSFGMSEPKYVAMYKARPDDIREAYDLTIKLLTLYNCQAMLEYTKISIQRYFQDKHKDNLLMRRPEWAGGQSRRSRVQKRLVGVSATEAVIRHGLELIAHYINDYYDQIDFPEMIDQMLNYSYELKRKFDIIAALQMAEIGDEELTGIMPKSMNTIKNQWKDIGYYIDEYGHKQYGVLPKNVQRWPT